VVNEELRRRAKEHTEGCVAGGVCCVKTGKCVLVGAYDDKVQPGAAANVVEKLADYLIEQGY